VVGGACELHGGPKAECAICQDLLAKAAAVEGRSEHALSQAILEQARAMGVEARYPLAEDVAAVPGMGIEGLVDGHTILVGSHAFCHTDGSGEGRLCRQVTEAEAQGQTVVMIKDACCDAYCYLAISDALRPGVAETISAVKDAGIGQTVMLTGDNPFIADAVAQKAGIDEVHAGLLPENKVRLVETLQGRYGRVAMVGDGVNDAPAMAKATVGIAMGAAGTDAALETADVALMNDDLSRLPFAIRLSRRAARIVRANIAFALGIKLVFLALALAGISTLWMAVLADTGASLVVTLNGLRMLASRE
jgi:Cd2+/Zn2+-exporting ATPase